MQPGIGPDPLDVPGLKTAHAHHLARIIGGQYVPIRRIEPHFDAIQAGLPPQAMVPVGRQNDMFLVQFLDLEQARAHWRIVKRVLVQFGDRHILQEMRWNQPDGRIVKERCIRLVQSKLYRIAVQFLYINRTPQIREIGQAGKTRALEHR